VNGYFGPLTEAAVKNWQSRNSLTVDGIVGPNTWTSLCGLPVRSAVNPYLRMVNWATRTIPGPNSFLTP
jgi:murein L,D-transpeptidase YcbB/YkuD